MMKTLLLRAFALFFFAGLPVAAEIIGVETFDYADGALAARAGGVFWDYKNTAPAGRSGTASAWSNLNGTPNVTSGQLVTSGNGVVRRAYNGSNESEGAISDANVAKTVYYRVNVTTGSVVSPGDYFGISSVNAGTEVFYFGKRGVNPNWAVEEVGVGGDNSTLSILPGRTYTLVAQVDLPGNAIRLYVDPNLSAAQSANTPTASRAYTGTAASTGVRFAAGTEVRWDNLVVATTWEELQVTVVTTAVDENGPDLTGSISLREAVNHSPPGSTILFAPALNGQTCTLSTGSEIVVTKSLTLDASSLPSGLTIDGGTGTNRLFTVDSGQSLTLRGLTLTGGNGGGVISSGYGGAIYNDGGTLTLTQCTLTGNSASDSASDSGGAIYNSGTLTLTQCTLSGNSATNDGGAIVASGGTLTLTQCTLSGNSASFGGGAISARGTLTLTQCTVSGNSATFGGAIDGGGTLTLSNSIVAANSAPYGPDVYNASPSFTTITTTGTNLLGSLADSTLTAGATVRVGDPKLSPLGYFGGRVQTMHPLIGSPAIDAAGTTDPGGTDARGFPRFVDGNNVGGSQLDIGAVEAGPLSLVTRSEDVAFGASLRNIVGSAGLSGEVGLRVVFDPAVFPASTITLNGTEIEIPATANGLFIDASNLSGPVTVSGNNASRVFNIVSGATVAMHSVRIVNGKAPDGANGVISPGTGSNGGNGGGGGGILNAGSLSLFSCTLQNNRAGRGGNGGTSGAVFNGNGGDGGDGGGIASSGALNLTACTLSGNESGGFGAATESAGASGKTGGGGGIFSSGSLSLTTCTLSGNSSGSRDNLGISGNGGGIGSSGSLRLTASTVSGNRCSFTGVGGGIFATTALLEDCIIGLNTRGNSTPNDVNVTTITYVGGNLLGTAATVTGAATGDPSFVETPSILALGDYGGPTQTVALQPSSPARNAGTVTARSTDQRGFPIVGAPDLGAYEAQIGAIADVTLMEGATPPTRTFSVGQIGALTATSSNPTLVPVGNIVITGSGASRSVTVTPEAGQRGICTITLTEDLHGEQQTFQVEVTEDTRFIVTTSDDVGTGSLRNALSLAASTAGINTIRFAPEVTSITLASKIIVNDTEPVVVDASSLSGGLVLNAGPNSRHFDVAVGASLTLRNMTLQDGNVTGHGGSVISFGTLILERCRLMNNRCTSRGGAVESQGPVFRAVDCSFTHNSASLSGGALGYRNGIVELTRCTFAGNTATTGAAVISDLATQSTVGTFLQCTFANNTASNPGSTGGIEVSFSTLNLIHCTVSQNTGIGATGGLKVSGTDVTLTHCIIAGNTSTGGGTADILLSSGTLTPRGANLIGSNQGVETIFPAGPLVGTAAAPLDPMLESFNSYGGPTNTMPPRVGSPALDQATVLDPALTTDQRGFARPLGIRPDLGAVEASIIVVTTPVDELDAPGSPGNGVSLREAVGDVPAGGAIDFDRAIFGGATAYVLTLTQGPLNPPQNGFLFNTANPNGLRIQYAATITQQPQSQSVVAGANATFSVNVANLSGGVAYQWRKDGIGEAITPSLSLSNAQEINEGVYDVVLSEAFSGASIVPAGSNFTIFPVSITPFSGVSQPASLVVDGAPVTIRQITPRTVAPLGSSQRLSVVAVGPGTLPLTYQWSLNGKRISGATQSTYTIPKLALTHAGSYSCVVKSGLTEASVSTELAVVDTTPKVLNIKSNTPFTATVIAAGNGLAYAWKKDGAPFFNLIVPTFTLGLTDVSNAGLFTCDVSFQSGGGNTLTTGFNTRLNVSDAAPALATPLVLPPATIGHTYFYQLPVQNTPGAPATSFSVTGALPTGITFNKTTGVLSGRATVTKTGGYALSFKAGNATAFSQPAPATLTVNVVPPLAVGTFAGPMARSPLNDNLGGRFDLTTTASGLCSGSVTLGARAAIRFTNQLLLSAGTGDVILRANLPGITLADKTVLIAYLEVFAADQRAMLTLVHPTNRSTLQVPSWRNPWFISKTPALNKPATRFAAYYTLRLDPGTGGSVFPSGYGYASFTISTAGALTLAGRLPDGSGVTGGTFVSKDGEILLFNLLYGKRGSHVGQFVISYISTLVTDNNIDGTTTWSKPPPLTATTTDTVYKDGFGPLTLDAGGSVYVPPAKGALVMGLGPVAVGANNAKIVFGFGGLPSEFNLLLRIANPSPVGLTNTATVPLFNAALNPNPNPNRVTMTLLNAKTGAISGSFTIPGATPALDRVAPYFGQLMKIGGNPSAYGYFLLPSVPTGTQKVSTSPKLSGAWQLLTP